MSNNLVQLANYRPTPDQETVSVLRFLERLASAGRLKDVAVVFKIDGEDKHAFTGCFMNDGIVAASAANFLSRKLNEAAGILPSKRVG